MLALIKPNKLTDVSFESLEPEFRKQFKKEHSLDSYSKIKIINKSIVDEYLPYIHNNSYKSNKNTVERSSKNIQKLVDRIKANKGAGGSR